MKVTFWFLVAIGFVYAFYTGAVAIYSYYQVKDIVSETVKEHAGLDRHERADRIQQDVLKKASQSGLALDERAVRVTDENPLTSGGPATGVARPRGSRTHGPSRLGSTRAP